MTALRRLRGEPDEAAARYAYLFAAAGCFLSCYLAWRPSVDIMLTLSDGLFVVAFALLLQARRMPVEPLRWLTPFWHAGFLLLVGGLLIGSFYCPAPSRWLIDAAQYMFAWSILPIILLRRGTAETAGLIKAFVWGVWAMNLFGAIVVFTYTGTFEQARQTFGLDFLSGGRRLGAFATDANWNGAVLAMAIPAAIYLRSKRLVGRGLAVAWLMVLLLGVLLTASFTAFACSIAGIVLFVTVGGVLPSRRTGVTILLAGAIGFGALLWREGGLPAIFMRRVGNAVSDGDLTQAGTFEGRLELIREAWSMVPDHLLVGAGADQYRVISAMKAPVHNMYLLLWVEGGLPALFGWLIMLVVVFVAAVRCHHIDRRATALGLSVAGTFVMASTASPHMYARLWSVPLLLALAPSLDIATGGFAARRRENLRRKFAPETNAALA